MSPLPFGKKTSSIRSMLLRMTPPPPAKMRHCATTPERASPPPLVPRPTALRIAARPASAPPPALAPRTSRCGPPRAGRSARLPIPPLTHPPGAAPTAWTISPWRLGLHATRPCSALVRPLRRRKGLRERLRSPKPRPQIHEVQPLARFRRRAAQSRGKPRIRWESGPRDRNQDGHSPSAPPPGSCSLASLARAQGLTRAHDPLRVGRPGIGPLQHKARRPARQAARRPSTPLSARNSRAAP